MSMRIAPIPTKQGVPLNVILKLNSLVKKSVLSRNFYQEITDKVLTKASTTDSVLYFVCYFTLLLSSILNNKAKIRKFLQEQRIKLVLMIERLTGSSLNDSKWVQKLKTRGIISEKPSQLAIHLKSISSYISDIRIFNRLGDSIKYMPWIIDEYKALYLNSAVPFSHRFINLAQALNCLVLELLENAGWLTEHNWVGTGDNDWWCMFTYIWCSRVWGAYLVIEIIELIRRTPASKWDKNWKISLFSQVIQLPLVVHWSLYDGCLSPFWVGVCGCGASWWGFKDVINSIKL